MRRTFFGSFRTSTSSAQVGAMIAAMEARPSKLPPPAQKLRIQLFLLFEEPTSSPAAQAVSLFILGCIVFSIALFVAETMPSLKPHIAPSAWHGLELFCTLVFTVEYVTRLCVCTVAGKTVCGFIKAPMNVIDIVAILPFYLWAALQNVPAIRALGVLRTVRLVRLFRVLKLGRYSAGMQLMFVALKNSSQAALVLMFFLVIGLVLFSSAVYYAEKVSCPDQEELSLARATDGSNRTQLQQYVQECFDSVASSSSFGICCNDYGAPMAFPTIIEATWWSIVTMTTVGFGDVVPQTTLGRIVGGITMLSGILLIALPIAIIGTKFQEAYDDYIAQQPHLNKPKSEARKQAEVKNAMYLEMSRRLRRVPFVDPEMEGLARDCAEGMEDLAQIEQEMWSMQKCENDTQYEALKSFDQILSKLLTIDPMRSFASIAASAKAKNKIRQEDSVSAGSESTPASPKSPASAQQNTSSVLAVNASSRARAQGSQVSMASVVTVQPPGSVLS